MSSVDAIFLANVDHERMPEVVYRFFECKYDRGQRSLLVNVASQASVLTTIRCIVVPNDTHQQLVL